MSISPRKCISLRELQTTRMIPTVCSPSTSHLSWKKRSILPSCLSLCSCQQKSVSSFGASTFPRPLPPVPQHGNTVFVPSVSLYVVIFSHPNSAQLPHLLSSLKLDRYSPRFFFQSVAAGMPSRYPTPSSAESVKGFLSSRWSSDNSLCVLAGWWQLWVSVDFQPLAVKLPTLRLSSLSFLPYLRHSSAAVSLLCLTGSVVGLYEDKTEEEDEKFKKRKDWRTANYSLKKW